MKITIVGSRNFKDYFSLEKFILNCLKNNLIKVDSIVSGGAIGADSLAEQFAINNGLKEKLIIYRPDWNKYGKSAGYRRNIDIIKNSDIVFAFWDGYSKGTLSSIKLCKDYKKTLFIYFF